MAAFGEENCQMFKKINEFSNGRITITDLPSEIIQCILKCSILSIQDVCRTACTCRKLYDSCVLYSNKLWKAKVDQRWPCLSGGYNHTITQYWLGVCKSRHVTGISIRKHLQHLDVEFQTVTEIPPEKLYPFAGMIEIEETCGDFVVDELLGIVHDGKRHCNLTLKYYAVKVLRHIQQLHLSKRWQTFLDLPHTSHTLESGACLISQWCQPTEIVTEKIVVEKLDHIVRLVKQEVMERCLDHPVLTYTFENEEFTKCLWSPKHCRVVLETLNYIMFEKLQFRGNMSEYYDPLNSFIDRVLERKQGIPITLSVVYCCVARRLGVLCEPVNFPSHFLLRWQEHPLAATIQKYTFIDAFHGGQFYSSQECCQALGLPESTAHDSSVFDAIEHRKVFERMARNLVGIGRHQNQMGDGLLCLRNALDLSLVICPNDVEMRLLQARINLHLNINLPEVIESLQRVADLDNMLLGIVAYLQQEAQKRMEDNTVEANKQKVQVKLRNDNKAVKFTTGMIMTHKKYHYMCVIYGWDSTCQATEEWIVQMGVNRLPDNQYQPFYNVLVQDGSNRYAAQENLHYPDVPREINHPEIGRYFEEYCETHYKPNRAKLEEYPDDRDVSFSLINEHYYS